MTNANCKAKRTKGKNETISEFKELIRKGEIQLKDIFDALDIKTCRKVARKIKKDVEKKQKSETSPFPSCGKIDEDDDEREWDDSASDPFPEEQSDVFNAGMNEGNLTSDSNNQSDVFNEGINEENLTRSLRRDYSQDDYATDRSIVTRENQHIPRRVDPFNDRDKMIGQFERKGNPESTAPIEMRPAEDIKLFSEILVDGLNKQNYSTKLEKRKTLLLRRKVNKERLEPKPVTENDIELRKQLKKEAERAKEGFCFDNFMKTSLK